MILHVPCSFALLFFGVFFFLFKVADTSDLYQLPSNEVYCSLILLYLGFSLALYFYTCSILLALFCDRIFKLLHLLWSLKLTWLATENLLFSRRWHYSSSLWFLVCPQITVHFSQSTPITGPVHTRNLPEWQGVDLVLGV